MPAKKAAWGIEIGANAVKAIRLERTGSEVVLTDFAVVPYAKVLSTPESDHDALVTAALTHFAQTHQEKLKDPIVISLPGHAAFARFAKLPPVEPKKIPDIVKFEAVQQIPFPIEEVEWDYQVFTSTDTPEVEVGIFAVTKERLQSRLALYADCGIRPEAITLSPLALFNAASYDLDLGVKHKPIVLLDIGTTASDLVVAEDGRCWIRTFPVGGSQFTDAIAAGYDLPYGKAERLKREGATSKHARQLMHAMKSVFEQLLEEITRSRGYYETLHRENPLDTMYAVGSTLKIPGLRKFIGQQLQVEVHRMDEFKRLRVEGKEAADFAANAVNLGTAYGLALQGVGLSKISVNLTPVQAIRAKVWRSKAPWFMATAALVAVAGGVLLAKPILERRAIDRSGVPSVVNTVLSRGSDLRAQFDAAQGLSDVGETAPNMMALTDWRSVWPQIVRDAYDATASVGPQSALLGSDIGAILAIPAKDRRLITIIDLHGSYSYSAETQARRITVTMDIEITKPDQTIFLNEEKNGLLAWFSKNAVRPQVPYKILLDPPIALPEGTDWARTVHKSGTGAPATDGTPARGDTGGSGGARGPAFGGQPTSGREGDDLSGSGFGTSDGGGEGGSEGGGGGGGGPALGGAGAEGGGGGVMQGRNKGPKPTDAVPGGPNGLPEDDALPRRRRDGPPPSGAEILELAKIGAMPSLFADGEESYRAKLTWTVELLNPAANPTPAEGSPE